MKLRTREIFILVGVIVVAIALPLSLWLVKNTQDTRSEASETKAYVSKLVSANICPSDAVGYDLGCYTTVQDAIDIIQSMGETNSVIEVASVSDWNDAYDDPIVINSSQRTDDVSYEITVRSANENETAKFSTQTNTGNGHAVHIDDSNLTLNLIGLEYMSSLENSTIHSYNAAALNLYYVGVYDSKAAGVYYASGTKGTVQGCTFARNYWPGVSLHDNSEVEITNSTFADHSHAGVDATDNSVLDLYANTISGNNSVLEKNDEVDGCDGTEYKNNGSILYRRKSSGVVVQNKFISNNKYAVSLGESDCYDYKDSSSVKLISNNIEGRYGVALIGDSYIYAESNKFNLNDGTGFILNNNSNAFLYNNLINNNNNNKDKSGVVLYGSSSAKLYNNTITGFYRGVTVNNHDYGEFTNGESMDLTAYNNIIYNNVEYGIVVYDGGTNDIVTDLGYNNVWGNKKQDYRGAERASTDVSFDPHLISSQGYQHEWKTGNISWEEMPSLPMKTGDGVAGIIGDTLYYMGGWAGTVSVDTIDNGVYSLDLTSNSATWQRVMDMPSKLEGASSVVYNDRIYFFGGALVSGLIDNVYSFDGTSFRQEQSLPVTLNFSTASMIGDRFYILGGLISAGPTLYSENIYSSIINNDGTLSGWEESGKLPYEMFTSSINIKDNLYIIGGRKEKKDFYESELTDVEKANISDSKVIDWATAISLPQKLKNNSLISNNSNLYSIGGNYYDNKKRNLTNAYKIGFDSSGNLIGEWEELSLPEGYLSRAKSVVYDNQIIVMGGDVSSIAGEFHLTNKVWRLNENTENSIIRPWNDSTSPDDVNTLVVNKGASDTFNPDGSVADLGAWGGEYADWLPIGEITGYDCNSGIIGTVKDYNDENRNWGNVNNNYIAELWVKENDIWVSLEKIYTTNSDSFTVSIPDSLKDGQDHQVKLVGYNLYSYEDLDGNIQTIRAVETLGVNMDVILSEITINCEGGTPVSDNKSPEFDPELKDQIATQTLSYLYKINPIDSDDDELTVTSVIPSELDWLIFDENTNQFSGTPDEESSTGTYKVTVKVTDGENNITESFNITVESKPDDSPILSLNIDLQVKDNDSNPEVTIKIGDKTFMSSSDSEGKLNSIVLTGVSAEEQKIWVKPRGYLSRVITINLVNGENKKSVDQEFLAGDIHEDYSFNIIKAADYTMLAAKYFKEDELRNLDGNPLVNAKDVTIMGWNWFVQGESL